jgi:hypothetical protein
MRVGFRPDHEHIGDGAVGNPGLRAIEAIAVCGLLGAGLHAGRIGAGIGLGEAEAADELAARELREIFLALRFRAIGIDRIHHEARLHAHHRAIARIDALHLARHQTVAHIGRADAAIGLGDRHAEQPDRAHFAEYRGIGLFVEIGFLNARGQFFGSEGCRRITDHPLIFGQLCIQQERIRPIERDHAAFGGWRRSR